MSQAKEIAAQLNPCVLLFPTSSSILTGSAGKEIVSLPSTSTTTKLFSQPPCFPLRYSPNLASINIPHPMMTRQQTSTNYSQKSSRTCHYGYNSYVYHPHQQKYHQTDPTK